MLELGDAQLELVPFVARDESELAQHTVQRGAGTLAGTHGVAAPAGRRLLDPRVHLVAAQTAPSGKRVGQLIRAFRRERNRTDERQQQPFQRVFWRSSAHLERR